jgi:hypothetical protein
MSMELLRKLADTQLPFTVRDRIEIDQLRWLNAVGHIKAFIPAVHVDCDDCARQDPAVVVEITPRGRQALNRERAEGAEVTVQHPALPPRSAPPRDGLPHHPRLRHLWPRGLRG